MKPKRTKPTVIRKLIAQLGLTQAQAAHKIHLHERTMRVYCSLKGNGAPPVVELALRQLISQQVKS